VKRICPPRAHVGPITWRRRDASRAQQQCEACYAPVGRPMPLEELTEDAQRDLRWWLRRQPGDGRGNSKKRDRSAFYRSKAWAEQRKRVIDRAGGVCEGDNCGERAVTAHHESYRPILSEAPDSELRASCMRCNGHERQERIRRGVLG